MPVGNMHAVWVMGLGWKSTQVANEFFVLGCITGMTHNMAHLTCHRMTKQQAHCLVCCLTKAIRSDFCFQPGRECHGSESGRHPGCA